MTVKRNPIGSSQFSVRYASSSTERQSGRVGGHAARCRRAHGSPWGPPACARTQQGVYEPMTPADFTTQVMSYTLLLAKRLQYLRWRRSVVHRGPPCITTATCGSRDWPARRLHQASLPCIHEMISSKHVTSRVSAPRYHPALTPSAQAANRKDSVFGGVARRKNDNDPPYYSTPCAVNTFRPMP